MIEPMIVGDSLAPDDLRFALDLGLVRETDDGRIEIANPIYREIIVRSLGLPPPRGAGARGPTAGGAAWGCPGFNPLKSRVSARCPTGRTGPHGRVTDATAIRGDG